MSQKQNTEAWQNLSSLGPCICSQLRRTARKVSSLYDQALAGTSLTITQYALLINIGRAGEIGRSALAAQIGMDRTTLTRNLKPLERDGLITTAESEDRRERLLCLSSEGRRKLRQSYPLWEKAQKEFTSQLGCSTLQALRSDLEAAEKAAESVNV
jgi:DNA-binding MarR family transcriptional regulator